MKFDVATRRAGARRRRILRALRAERSRRGDRPDPQGYVERRRPVRGLHERSGNRKEDPPQRVRAGRRVVSHRRPDAQGRAGLFLFRRPHRRHLPLEGRERGDLRGGRGDQRTSAEVAEANVYGVAIPGHRRAAPAWRRWCSTDDSILRVFRSYLAERLPAYARPMFVRIKRTIAVTDTFKHKKKDLASEGYNPSVIDDPIYFDDPTLRAFVPLDTALYGAIQRGDIRL